MKLVLGIESSCDETAAAVVEDGTKILSNCIASQIEIHRPFGGVVPELASREHLARITIVVNRALEEAGLSLSDIDGYAVTSGPGLIGSLLVGVCYAKSLAYVNAKPIVGVNHLEGHIYSVVFENPPIEYPALAMVVSGGHTSIYYIPVERRYELLGHTRDDAAGEAFDKTAKLLGLGYPGGPAIERLACRGKAERATLVYSIPQITDARYDFSFSGLKTAVLRYVSEHGLRPAAEAEEPSDEICDLAASFQQAVVRTLVSRMVKAARDYRPRTLILTGGVACNKMLRQTMLEAATKLGLPLYYPSPKLTTDNAAMIAAAGYGRLLCQEDDAMTLTASASLKLHTKSVSPGKGRFKLA
ncbi:MAG: tRNA (adenosine(37)-N6)-threonylcarbamoyltransferase complex transferase subunit TsaD [Acidobacteriota bacterium]|nr:tRNA (adenosine(37)-N6)-threonylcarbamoyltransferase complex transferase subunit TsaD [Blastocatellia bacterium]MDW8413361.1 tRNA (adenosine(37)-N6)-threonylcarbamoyltransferase complex transferase subunit TsaD [Acidobacteriota bacterium]